MPNVEYTIDGAGDANARPRGAPYTRQSNTPARAHDPQEMPTVLRFKATGFWNEVLEFNFFLGEWPTLVQSWMVQYDMKTHVVMRWGDYPEDLDLVIVPLGVVGVDKDVTPVEWSVMRCDDAGAESCGVWVQAPTDGAPRGALGSLATDQAYLWYYQKQIKGNGVVFTDNAGNKLLGPTLTIDRDDSGHGPPTSGAGGAWPNGPEAMTLENLLPGAYEVYVTAYDPNDITQRLRTGLTLDIYLGTGMADAPGRPGMIRADSIQLFDTLDGAKWYFAGKFVVTTDEPPANPTQLIKFVQPGRQTYHYSWFGAGAIFAEWQEYLFEVLYILPIKLHALPKEPHFLSKERCIHSKQPCC